ncbi:MAG TPA: ATP-dependent DNA ligase, partial [Pseudonocardia sp.]|nr:ATP-dependent DNA ligase [Pseudonocardia sp.]
FSQFEGAGLDGVVAKPLAGTYQPDKRTMFKIKHQRTADCVVAGYRVHKSGPDSVGSLLLGLYNDAGELASVGVIGAFPAARRKELFAELQPMITTFDDHPWAWAKQEEGARTPRNSEYSRWNNGKDLSFVPLRPELVVEVRYEHMEGVRFRHTAQFNRWRPDRDPRSCTYEQLEEPVKFDLAEQWFSQFEGAGLDGVVAKPLDGGYLPDKRVMFKIKHQRTADCVVAGYRVHKSGPDSIGSLLLGLYNDEGDLASVGVIGAFPAARRKELFAELQPMVTTFDDHPWAWAKQEEGARTPRNSEYSRWNNGKDLSFVPLRPELVVEVRYEHMEGVRFRHTAQFNRWRPDRDPRSCTYEQLEEPVKFDLADILSA